MPFMIPSQMLQILTIPPLLLRDPMSPKPTQQRPAHGPQARENRIPNQRAAACPDERAQTAWFAAAVATTAGTAAAVPTSTPTLAAVIAPVPRSGRGRRVRVPGVVGVRGGCCGGGVGGLSA